ncbi:Spy/CpxP family protein refolding chaperone [Bradyrhizobium manausense]|uniref:Spy/CpxP family protein refolding chaperone n=1 Tax=Bradyrhizobium TaxID=374 RepID=UPI001BA986DD|nr:MULTISPECIES: Spy/CpxP family protein refolding chaperone [Bradyrhizobium]MBR0824568.1 Spy/CpxP family protein refolding chaperone [Bradyrhizobium manausense]UVO29642.1 Spy/CpxP family protein refolding chaperone [Bradyrhizobium arachidis]
MKTAAGGLILVVLATLLPAVAEAGFGFRGGPVGVVRSAMGRVLSIAGVRHARMAARHRYVRAAAMQPRDIRPATRPTIRMQATAMAALAGWQGGRSTQGWWQHADGTYGWVGPLFWPFAYGDLYDTVATGNAMSVWSYGYRDINAAIFTPYAASDLVAYEASNPSGRRGRKFPSTQELCNADTGDFASLPPERIERAIQLSEAQRAGLDELNATWASAGETIRAACPADTPATALDRVRIMQRRLEAMVKALAAVQPPLQKFTSLLDDNQKAKLNALAVDQPNAAPARTHRARHAVAREPQPSPAAACQAAQQKQAELSLEQQAAQFETVKWPIDEIAANLHLDATGRATLDVLQDTALRSLEFPPCPPESLKTMPARLNATKARLETLLQSVKDTSDALDDFYVGLSDEQKAGFEAMGPKRGV